MKTMHVATSIAATAVLLGACAAEGGSDAALIEQGEKACAVEFLQKAGQGSAILGEAPFRLFRDGNSGIMVGPVTLPDSPAPRTVPGWLTCEADVTEDGATVTSLTVSLT